MWSALLAVVVVLLVLWVLRGPPLLARFEVIEGKPRLVKGRMPHRLHHDFEDVLSDHAIERADVRIVVEGGRPRLSARGLDDGREQQLRNVLGPWKVAQIRAGRRQASG
jgi:hypothetical protein